MKTDYTYCTSTDCIHRRGCKRALWNYSDDEVKELYTKSRFVDEIDYSDCIPNYSDVNCTNDFHFLDRYRLSDGSELK